MRLVLISLGSIVFVSMILMMVRFWGLGRTTDSFDHPWFHLKTPWVVTPWMMAKEAPADAILWVDVLRSNEQHLFALKGPAPLEQKRWTDAELTNLGLPLKETLESLRDRNLVVSIRSNEENIDLQVSDLIGKSGNGRILLQSEFDLVMESIKKLQPLWLFGSSEADRVRFATFQSLWILPATPFKGDVYVGPFKKKKIRLLTEEILAEVKRRGKKVIVGPIESKDEYDTALRLGADGVLIDRPELLGLGSSR